MIELKKKIIEAGIKKHLSVMNDFQERIREIMKTDANVNEDEYDSQVQSHKSEELAEANLLTEQLQFAAKELDELRRIESYRDEKCTTVGFGTVVLTDKGTFFVSASIEEFDVDGKSIFGLSVQSPLYKDMRGKKIGETFRHGIQAYKIKEIL